MAALDKQGEKIQERVDLTLKTFMDKTGKRLKVEDEARRKRRHSSSAASSDAGSEHSEWKQCGNRLSNGSWTLTRLRIDVNFGGIYCVCRKAAISIIQ